MRLRNHAHLWLAMGLAVVIAVSPARAAAPQKKPVERHTVSGAVVGLAPGQHVLIKTAKVYSLREPHSASTRGDGGYTLRGLTPGTYTVRPSHPRYHFTPPYHTVAVRNSDVSGVDFTAAPTAWPKKR